MASNESLAKRIEQLESAVSYLQNDYETLNGVVLEINGRLDQMQAALDRLTLRLESVQEPEETRSLEEERPPHY